MAFNNLFGNNNNAASGSNTPGAAAPAGGLFGKPATAQPTGGLFGGTAPSTTPATTGPGLFGFGNPTNTSTSNATGSTPAAAPAGGGLFGNTTTTSAPAGTLFGGATTTPASTSTPAAAPAPPAGGLFGFGQPKAADSTSTPAAAPAPPAGGLFGFGQPKPADQSAAKPATNSFFAAPSTAAGTTSTTPAAAPLFGTTPATTSTTAAGATGSTPASTPAPTAGGNLFGGALFGAKPATPAAGTSTPATTGATGSTGTAGATGSTPNLFGGTPAATTPSAGASTNTSTTTPATNLFGSTATPASKPEEKKDGAPAAASNFGIFGAANANKPAEKKDEAPKLGATSTAPGSTAPGSSTQIAVAAPSMLRGKTIEEIVNSWTGELEQHVKVFGTYATDVAVWDRALVESGNNLSALYATLLAAEREQDDVDQSLDHIEQQQRDLAATLDAYEKVTDEILGSSSVPSQGGAGAGLRSLDTGPADTERDRNYMLATELHGHLDDLSASLTQMIESVNALSPNSTSNLSSSTTDSALASTQSGPALDDPLTQIAQVLANHLESLQWIDGAVREVEAKVVDVERRVRGAAGDSTAGLASPRLGAGSIGPGGGARGAGGIGGDYNARFGYSGR